jgi:23S rRNA pseudouridine955/2504/2580 synthase
VRVNGRRAKPAYRLAAAIASAAAGPGRRSGRGSDARQGASKSLREFVAAAVIFEDRDLIVVNKPAGVAVHGRQRRQLRRDRSAAGRASQLKELELVHRLDRETSGCLLVAKRRAVLRDLHAQLREREMEKRYLALVAGRWPFGPRRSICRSRRT